jgi:serine/threonine protein kinase
MSMIGKLLAHYEVTAEIGKGGMGEVYQATDTKLGRDVAIKVLPEEFARDADRVARFQREAKLLASLNHPNIAAIYGLEESDGIHFLVMELIEGDTLAGRIKTGPIPVEESLKLALQIAEALETAHEKGVIHRDLKPANIKVTPDGKVKVLDFGLAKAFAGDPDNINLSNSPTLSDMATQQGVILGTAAYMSPEQASGKTIDKKADIWAFGVVLFEMLTGRSLFAGENVSQTLARVLERQPDFSILPPNLHPKVGDLLKRCLQKESKNRYHDIADIRLDIIEVLANPSGVLVKPVTAEVPQKKLRTILPWIAAAIVFGGVAVWLLKPPPPPEQKQVIRFDYELPEGQQFSRGTDGGISLAVSPDGSQFAYSTTKGIYIRSMSELDARLIPGTDEDAQALFLSPDGQWIGYFSPSDQKLKSISINGGAPTDLCEATIVYSATWHEDNTIVYADLARGVCRIPAKGGTPELLVERPLIAYGRLLPGGKSVLFGDVSSQPYKTMVHSLETGDQKVIYDKGLGGYSPTGLFIYEAEGSFFARPFDPDKLEFAGGAVSVMTGEIMGFATSDSGTFVYVPGTTDSGESAASPKRILVWVNRDGKEDPLPAPPNEYNSLKLSPDGTKVALSVLIVRNTDIRIWDTARNTLTRLTFDEAVDTAPLWTLDGQRIIYYSARRGGLSGGLFSRKADGTGDEEELYSPSESLQAVPWSWSKDGKTLALLEFSMTPLGLDIGTLAMEVDRQRKELLHDNYVEADPQISPDGRWIAYTSTESGQAEVYVRPFPDVQGGGRWQVSTSGGHSPLWSPVDGELFYRNGDTTMAVPVDTDPAFSPGNPKTLFRGTYFTNDIQPLKTTLTPWDISPDGKRFLMIKPPAVKEGESSEASTAAEPRKIIIVTNWFEELKQRVPVK